MEKSFQADKKIIICLVTCVNEELEKSQMFGVKYLPVWALTLSAYLRDIPTVECIHYDRRIHKGKNIPAANLFLMSGINQDVEAILEFAAILKRKFVEAKVVLGGPITTSYSESNSLNEFLLFDSLFIGDAESSFSDYINQFLESGELPKVHFSEGRFKLQDARPMDFSVMGKDKDHYYGGIIEVSRGCPFLCEFCDIRTLPDNNKANNKSIEVICSEINSFCELGMGNILFACDNFIGDSAWAEELCDAILKLKKEKKINPSFYTWLTINISLNPRLLAKMRECGFEMFFIGVESFNVNQLLETAKVQNVSIDLKVAIENIQSFGFIVVAGIIFGFDTDGDDVADITLNGIEDCGLISGDPSLLTALPGTPLYQRMKLAGRLRKGKLGLGGHKYHTNIVYVRDRDKIVNDFLHFVKVFNSSEFQVKRFKNFLDHSHSDNFIQREGKGYIDVGTLVKMMSINFYAAYYGATRLIRLFVHPVRIRTIIKGYFLFRKYPKVSFGSFGFWLFNWSNSLLKYQGLSVSDFDIDSLGRAPLKGDILPEGYETSISEPIPRSKAKAQRKITIKALSEAFGFVNEP